jgi:hypothetical protein
LSVHTAKLLQDYLLGADVCLLLAVFVLVFRSGASRRMPFFATFLAFSVVQFAMDWAILYHRRTLGISPVTGCKILGYGGVAFDITEVVFLLLTIYGIFEQLIEPMAGLRRMGTWVFRWVAGVAVCLGAIMALGPHQIGSTQLTTLFSQFQEGVTILTLCLLLAVALATRPLGLSVKSRLFGTLVGLGIMCATGLVAAVWFSTEMAQSPYSPIHLLGFLGCMGAAVTWAVYFLRPEPARRMVTLPTTSPFFFWNRVAETLGDAPGEVAVAGVSPDMFTSGELIAFSSTLREPAPVVEISQAARR